jgi:hypothetical protein
MCDSEKRKANAVMRVARSVIIHLHARTLANESRSAYMPEQTLVVRTHAYTPAQPCA